MGSRRDCVAAGKAALAALLGTSSLSLIPAPALAQQPTYTALQFDGSTFTGLTGIRGDNIDRQLHGQHGRPDVRIDTGTWCPSRGHGQRRQFPGAQSPALRPDFGSPTASCASSAAYKTDASAYDIELHLGRCRGARVSRPLTLVFPEARRARPSTPSPTAQFGNQAVGNYDTKLEPATPSTTTSRPAASRPTRARRDQLVGLRHLGDRIAGG